MVLSVYPASDRLTTRLKKSETQEPYGTNHERW